MVTGDDRYLPVRDKARRSLYIRDYADARLEPGRIHAAGDARGARALPSSGRVGR